MLDLHFCIIIQVGLYTIVTGFMQSRKNLMAPFCDGETRVLVCTDLASRGIDHDKVWKSLEVLLCIIWYVHAPIMWQIPLLPSTPIHFCSLSHTHSTLLSPPTCAGDTRGSVRLPQHCRGLPAQSGSHWQGQLSRQVQGLHTHDPSQRCQSSLADQGQLAVPCIHVYAYLFLGVHRVLNPHSPTVHVASSV